MRRGVGNISPSPRFQTFPTCSSAISADHVTRPTGASPPQLLAASSAPASSPHSDGAQLTLVLVAAGSAVAGPYSSVSWPNRL